MAGASRRRKVPEQAEAHGVERERPEEAEGPEEETVHPEITLSGIAREAKERKRMRVQEGLNELRQSLEGSEQRRLRKGKAVVKGTIPRRWSFCGIIPATGAAASSPENPSPSLSFE